MSSVSSSSSAAAAAAAALASVSTSRTPYVALDFSQQTDVVRIPSVDVTSSATISVWINPSKPSPLGYVIFKKSTFAIALQDQVTHRIAEAKAKKNAKKKIEKNSFV